VAPRPPPYQVVCGAPPAALPQWPHAIAGRTQHKAASQAASACHGRLFQTSHSLGYSPGLSLGCHCQTTGLTYPNQRILSVVSQDGDSGYHSSWTSLSHNSFQLHEHSTIAMLHGCIWYKGSKLPVWRTLLPHHRHSQSRLGSRITNTAAAAAGADLAGIQQQHRHSPGPCDPC